MPLTLPQYMLSTPADFLRASEAGASLGLSAGEARTRQRAGLVAEGLAQRKQADEESQFGAGQNLAYATLAENAQNRRLQQRALQQRAAEVLQQKYAQLASLAEYRRAQEGNMEEQRRQAASKALAPSLHPFGLGGVGRYDPKTGKWEVLQPERTPKASTALTQEQKVDNAELKVKLAENEKAWQSQNLVVQKDPENKEELAKLRKLQDDRAELLRQQKLIGSDTPATLDIGGVTVPSNFNIQRVTGLESGAADALSPPALTQQPQEDPLGLFK